MIRLVTIGGSGDCYLVCALLDAFRKAHNRADVHIVGPSKYATIAAMFGAPYHVDDDLVRRAEQDPEMQRTYENVLLGRETTFYVHPCFVRSESRPDKLTAKAETSQADMYRMLLRLPVDAPLAVPSRLPAVRRDEDSILLLPEAVSWPNTQPAFWSLLAENLRRAGRKVSWNDPAWTLAKLFDVCAGSGWVIGPQCGVMSILCTGRFPCRKTIASPRVTEANKKNWFLLPQTYPYAYVTKFSNDDYDVEEFEVTDANHEEIVGAIGIGANALRIRQHDPRPVLTIHVPLAPGDFLDRLAVLTVKRRRFEGRRRAAVEREYQRLRAIRTTTILPAEVDGHFEQLVAIHERSFALLEALVPASMNGGSDGHDRAILLNKDRIAVKGRIDILCRAPYTEEKSYYDAVK